MTPSLLNLPQGCAFASRCPRADTLCHAEPQLTRHPESRAARCHHPHLEVGDPAFEGMRPE
jgi:peptide/nickel transport system ATP-binding protein